MFPCCLYTSLTCTQLLGILFWPTQVSIHSSEDYSGYSEANKCQKKDKPYKTRRIAVLLYTEYDSPDSMLIITATISAINLTASRISTRSLDPGRIQSQH